jgi:hypothetical protein
MCLQVGQTEGLLPIPLTQTRSTKGRQMEPCQCHIVSWLTSHMLHGHLGQLKVPP